MKRVPPDNGGPGRASEGQPSASGNGASIQSIQEDAAELTPPQAPAPPETATNEEPTTPSATSSPIKIWQVLIVDDHPIVRAGLAQLISKEADLRVCGEASDAAGALQRFRETAPDLVMIDISLPNINGIELVKQIRALDKNVLMLVVSVHDGALYAERALRAGAMGYVNKHENWKTISGAIRRVLSGEVYLSREIADRMLHRVANRNHDLRQSPIESLSDRELEVFGMIGQGITTSEIAKKLFLSTKTIETHREKIKTKLHLRNACELIQYAVQWTFQEKQS